MTELFSPIAASERAPSRAVGIWLLVICALTVLMIVVGGLTRLTDSGLSITEWKPVTGAVPPLSDAAWAQEFAKYQVTTEYQVQNRFMSLAEFKTIYWWEWGHRFLGRLIGVVFLVPFLWFLWRGEIRRPLIPRLAGIFVLGGLQAALGWYMVQSGLVGRIDVSQYRLAAHLGVAFLIFALSWWTALDVLRGGAAAMRPDLKHHAVWALLFAVLVYDQILLGALVAGLDAGLTYNTWPLMDGRLVPEGLFLQSPWPLNFFENVTMVQFQHRILAYVVAACAVALWWKGRRLGLPKDAGLTAELVLLAVAVQIVLGIWTLLAVVPVALGALHQLGAVMLFAVALAHAHGLRRVS